MEGSGYCQKRRAVSSRASRSREEDLHEEIKNEILVWRIVLEKIATLEEIERSWSLDDLYRAEAVLDLRDELIADAQRKARENVDR